MYVNQETHSVCVGSQVQDHLENEFKSFMSSSARLQSKTSPFSDILSTLLVLGIVINPEGDGIHFELQSTLSHPLIAIHSDSPLDLNQHTGLNAPSYENLPGRSTVLLAQL